MTVFFQQRCRRHQFKMMRFMKYIFNDHFMIVCGIALGGLALFYADLVKELTPQFIWGRPLIGVLWFAVLFSGRLATLTKEADAVFLLPKERDMVGYLKRAYLYSLIVPFVLLLLVCSAAMPLYVAVTGRTFTDFFFFIIVLWALKAAGLLVQLQGIYLDNQSVYRLSRLIWLAGSLVSIALSLYVIPVLGVVIAAAVCLLMFVRSAATMKEKPLDWETMIDLENQRLKRLYAFINLFTDVPGIVGKVKRRRYFDAVLGKIKHDSANVYVYLYARVFLRGNDFLGLAMRLTVLAVILLLMTADFWPALLSALMAIYLIAFQLLPIYNQFDYMVLTKLYPVDPHQKKHAVVKLLSVVLTSVGAVLAAVSLLLLGVTRDGLIVTVLIFAEVWLFVTFYLPVRLKKIAGK